MSNLDMNHLDRGDLGWEPVIGLEVHAQLATATKLFCRCPTTFGAAPNTQVCEVCLAMPGSLPALNRQAVEYALRAALALECDVQLRSEWARKNYFYPDLPKGYQITQFDKPYALGGGVDIVDEQGGMRRINLTRIHMEEDAGKNIHVGKSDCSLVDYNRASTPLIEIVSNPEIRSPEEAADYLRRLHHILVTIGVCDGNMEEGSFRCDANVSIRRKGTQKFGTRVEIKNVNSFKYIAQAIHYEMLRQQEVLERGGAVTQETRLWDSAAKMTRAMRSKEEANDYRYFPDPDLPPLILDAAFIAQIKETLPELPHKKSARFVAQYGLPAYDAGVLCGDDAVSRFFEESVRLGAPAKAASNWVMTEILREMSEKSLEIHQLKVTAAHLAALIQLIEAGTISGKIAKDVMLEMLQSGEEPGAIVQSKGLVQVSDSASIEAAARQVLAANTQQVAQYRAGKSNLLGFFVGHVIKAMGGKANPAIANEVIKKLLDAADSI